jgi:predicted MFS family arabinose efflux permease
VTPRRSGYSARAGNGGPSHRPGFRQIFALAEFRALWAAQLLSVAGDQMARVALTVLVYQRTGSALLAAAAYAATIAPVFIGGVLLSGLADRWPRRAVMITCDLARAPVTALMAVPHIPIAALIGLLCVVTAVGAPFGSARAAIFPDVLGEAYPLGMAVTMTTYQAGQVLGFAVGGAIVSLAGAPTALLADAGTFMASAATVGLWVHGRPSGSAHVQGRARGGITASVRLTLGCPSVRTPMLLGWVSWAYNVPEGLAVPLARAAGGGAAAASSIMAAAALGSAAGAIALTRLTGAATRQHLTLALAFMACAILTAVAFRPGLPAILVILFASGLCDSYQVQANASFVAAVPDSLRGQAFGLALGGMQLGQGAVMVLAGAAAQHVGPSLVIAVTGGAGAAAAVLISFSRSGRPDLSPSSVPHRGPPICLVPEPAQLKAAPAPREVTRSRPSPPGEKRHSTIISRHRRD